MVSRITVVLPGLVVLGLCTLYFLAGNGPIRETKVSGTEVAFKGSSETGGHNANNQGNRVIWANKLCALRHSSDTVCAPLLAVIGAQKSGTSTLTFTLARHPSIRMRTKELPFFEQPELTRMSPDSILRNLHRQVGPLSLAAKQDTVEKQKISGFDRPNYLATPWTPFTLRRVWPGLNPVVILKHPVERTYSAFHHEVMKRGYRYPARSGKSSVNTCCSMDADLPRCFHQCVSLEIHVLRGLLEEFERNWTTHQYPCPRMGFYDTLHKQLCRQVYKKASCHFGAFPVLGSLYDLQLCNWWNYFDAKRTHIIWFDDMVKNRKRVIRRLELHIGLPPIDAQTLHKIVSIRRGSQRSSVRPPMLSTTKELLDRFFESHTQRLEFLVGGLPLHWNSNATK